MSDDKRSTADYLAHWLDNVLPGTVKETTEASYRWIVGKNIVPQHRPGTAGEAIADPPGPEKLNQQSASLRG